MLKDFFMLAARSITHRRMRSWLTVIGVFIGITAVVALISIGLGLNKTVEQQVAGVFGVDTFVLVPKGSFGPRSHAGGGSEQYALDLEFLKSTSGVKVAAAVRQRTGFVQGPTKVDGTSTQGFLPVMGLSTELVNEFESFTGELTVQPGGRLFVTGDTDVAVLGADTAERLGAEVGDSVLVAGDDTKELNLTVVGIMAPNDEEASTGSSGGFSAGMQPGQSKDTIYVPYDTMSLLWGEANDVLVTLVRTQPGADVDEVADRVEKELNARGSEVSSITYSDISDAIGTMTTTVSAFLAGIAGIALLVGAVDEGGRGKKFSHPDDILDRIRPDGVCRRSGGDPGGPRSERPGIDVHRALLRSANGGCGQSIPDPDHPCRFILTRSIGRSMASVAGVEASCGRRSTLRVARYE